MPPWRPLLASLALASISTASPPASADEGEPPAPDGVDIALRAGYGVPLGALAQNVDFNALMAASLPFVFEIGGRFKRDYTLAVYLQYGIGHVKNGETSGCGSGSPSCSSTDYRFGVEWLYRINQPGSFTQSFTPWIGFGIGYEILTLSQDGRDFSDHSSLSLSGFEFGAVQVGGDLHPTPTFALGPFISYSIGQFSTAATFAGNYGVPNPGLHSWLQLGVRATWSLSSP